MPPPRRSRAPWRQPRSHSGTGQIREVAACSSRPWPCGTGCPMPHSGHRSRDELLNQLLDACRGGGRSTADPAAGRGRAARTDPAKPAAELRRGCSRLLSHGREGSDTDPQVWERRSRPCTVLTPAAEAAWSAKRCGASPIKSRTQTRPEPGPIHEHVLHMTIELEEAQARTYIAFQMLRQARKNEGAYERSDPIARELPRSHAPVLDRSETARISPSRSTLPDRPPSRRPSEASRRRSLARLPDPVARDLDDAVGGVNSS